MRERRDKGVEMLAFDMPFASEAPDVLSDERGIKRIAALAGHCYTMDVTIIDTPDHRLMRAGVTLAHRIADGVGEWYLSAPSWVDLPDEDVRPVGASAELPEEFARLVRPIRRRGVVGPVVALRCERAEYVLRGESDARLALVRDDKVTVCRSGLVTNRFRESSLMPTSAFTAGQEDHVREVMDRSSAARVSSFPALSARLGTPATGLTDFPQAAPVRADMTLGEFVRHRFARRLREVVSADIRIAIGSGSSRQLMRALQATALDVRGLAPVLEPAWREQLEAELSGLGAVDRDSTQPPLQTVELMGVIDALVSAARAPRVGDLASRAAAPLFFERVEAGTRILVDRCRSLQVDTPDDRWVAALSAAGQLCATAKVGRSLHGRRATRFLTRLSRLHDGLRAGARVPEVRVDVSGMAPCDAFAEGYALGRARAVVATARADFVESWPAEASKLSKLVERS